MLSQTFALLLIFGTSHIGNLGSRENILKAKLEILEGCENPTIIINNDNDLLNEWYEKNKGNKKIITYGIKEKSDISAKDLELMPYNSKYICQIDGKNVTIEVPVGGEHFILNSLCAVAVGKTLGIETEKIQNGIKTFELTKKRMDITKLKNGIQIINDAYNASFESMQASLKVLGEFKENRKIAVLGDMFELGEFSKQLHEKVGKEVYKNKIDILICQGENAKYIAEEAKASGMSKENVYYLGKKEEIIPTIETIMKSGDIILFKASNGMKFYEIVEEILK